jgi:hypothetical protein
MAADRIDAKEFYRMLDGVVVDDTELCQRPPPGNGKTSTTSTAPTAASTDRPPTNGTTEDHDPDRISPHRHLHR